MASKLYYDILDSYIENSYNNIFINKEYKTSIMPELSDSSLNDIGSIFNQIHKSISYDKKNVSNELELFLDYIDNTLKDITINKETYFNDLDSILNVKNNKDIDIDTSCYNKTKYDDYIYHNYNIETLTQNNKEWKQTLKENKYNNKEFIKRLKQIRRSELQKKYNKVLRDRKKLKNKI